MRFLLAVLINAVRLVLWPILAVLRVRAAPQRAWLRVDVEGPVVEVAPRLPFWNRRRITSLHHLRQLLAACRDDSRVKGILFVISSWQGGSATASALRRVLVAAREQGKRVAVYLPRGGGTRTCYVASAADTLIIAPQSHLSPLGYAVQAQYLKSALEHLGVAPEVLAQGRFKAAGETLIADEMSAAQREQLSALLDNSHDILVTALAEGRKVSRELAEQWVDEAPWSAHAALRQGLADLAAHEDELAKKLDPSCPTGAPIVSAGPYLSRRVIRWRPWRRPRHIGIIELHGAILPAPSGLPTPIATEERFTSAIERALEDRSVQGAIVHISSPGGSVLVSDAMLHGVRRLAQKKPVVACFGDVAASGGYLAAMGAGAIYAEPTTITGSIGVVAARLGIGPLLEKLGVNVQTVKRGKRADMNSPARALTVDEREELERELADVYAYFVDAVAQGRGRATNEIEPLAEGRVYSGTQAMQLGLIDGLGGFPEALADVRQRIGPRAERLEPRVVSPNWQSSDALTALIPSRMATPSLQKSVALLALANTQENVWLWCPHNEVGLGDR